MEDRDGRHESQLSGGRLELSAVSAIPLGGGVVCDQSRVYFQLGDARPKPVKPIAKPKPFLQTMKGIALNGHGSPLVSGELHSVRQSDQNINQSEQELAAIISKLGDGPLEQQSHTIKPALSSTTFQKRSGSTNNNNSTETGGIQQQYSHSRDEAARKATGFQQEVLYHMNRDFVTQAPDSASTLRPRSRDRVPRKAVKHSSPSPQDSEYPRSMVQLMSHPKHTKKCLSGADAAQSSPPRMSCEAILTSKDNQVKFDGVPNFKKKKEP